MMATVDPEFWAGKRVFLTGHTGFKGSWLSLWLQSMGAEVFGYALAPPTEPALFDITAVASGMTSQIGNILDAESLTAAVLEFRPEIVIHMAAQPLVRASYSDPVETFSTNVMGTVNVLEAVRAAGSVRAVVNVTTDKCYENREWPWGYRENEAMGGHDPYSSSKGCAELVTAAYRRSFFESGATALASARAGNVIGGGDWAEDRLIPDILQAFADGKPVEIRNPTAIRPWQHVLEPLSGYLLLAQQLFKQGKGYADAWNFGPRDADAKPVGWIVAQLSELWQGDAEWRLEQTEQPHEAHYLKLDISKAASQLGWTPAWNLPEALQRIVSWQQHWVAGGDMRQRCLQEIAQYHRAQIAQQIQES